MPANRIDSLVLAMLEKRGIEPAPPCSDEVFIRRVYIDVIGTLPEPTEVIAFLEDNRPNKRSLLIDELINRPEFADYWSLKWCDILRVKSEFPINLWPNAVQAYHRWILASIRDGMPYDEFVRELLTSSGSNFRRPPVNFYRAVPSKDPHTIAAAAALTFMGVRFDNWPEERRSKMAAFFSRIAFKNTAEWKEEIVYLSPEPKPEIQTVFPDGERVSIPPWEDPRMVFADWLTAPDNPWFARNIVNRIWSWLLGRGIIHEPDDIRDGNPASNPELLDFLEKELVNAGYDLRHIYRLILNSRTYQQSSIPRDKNPEPDCLFAYYQVRRIEAEVLIDALCMITATGEEYTSRIPEPFTYVPKHQRSILLADGSITSPFLELFGRPPRDTGLESERENAMTDKHHFYLMNSTNLQRRILRSPLLRTIARDSGRNREEAASQVYLLILSRRPTPFELSKAVEYFQGYQANFRHAVADIAWALINSKEFLYRH